MPAFTRHRLPLRKLLLTMVLCGMLSSGLAQRVLLSHTVTGDSLRSKWWQNLRHYIHPYLGAGFLTGVPQQGARILPLVSASFELGARYKLRIARHYSLGLNAVYTVNSFKLRQSASKRLPDSLLHRSERFLFSNFGLGFFNRINLGRTGNHIGTFIDLGIYGDWIAKVTHVTSDDETDGTRVHSHRTGMCYTRDLQYGLFGNIGFTRYVFTVKYRLSDLFTPSSALPELPRWTIGMQLGLHKVN